MLIFSQKLFLNNYYIIDLQIFEKWEISCLPFVENYSLSIRWKSDENKTIFPRNTYICFLSKD